MDMKATILDLFMSQAESYIVSYSSITVDGRTQDKTLHLTGGPNLCSIRWEQQSVAGTNFPYIGTKKMYCSPNSLGHIDFGTNSKFPCSLDNDIAG
jgi:hypothetical protein